MIEQENGEDWRKNHNAKNNEKKTCILKKLWYNNFRCVSNGN